MAARLAGGASFGLPDWRNGEDYAWLLPATRPVFAWEWLRRSLAYRAAWDAGGDPSVHGLLRFEDPAQCGLTTRPLWSAAVEPAVLRCHAIAGNDFCASRVAALGACWRSGAGVEHWLYSDGLRAIRLDVTSGTLAEGPVALRFEISGLSAIGPQTLALRRFAALVETGQMPIFLFAPEQRAARWVRMLRAADAVTAGAHHRDIAETILAAPVSGPRWRLEAPSWRLRAQRLVAAARSMIIAGPEIWF